MKLNIKHYIFIIIIINMFLFVFTFAQANTLKETDIVHFFTSDQVFNLLLCIAILSTLVLYIFMLFDRYLIVRYKSISKESNLPIVIEGITIILIIITVTVLRLSSSISSEGTVSIFSTIVGYVLGRNRIKKSQTNKEVE